MSTKLRTLRLKHGMTQAYLADILGISRPYYALVESGKKRISLQYARKLADLFQISLDDVYGIESNDITLNPICYKSAPITNLEILRRAYHMTQEELAQKLGISRQFYNLCEKGKRKMGIEPMLRCAQIFHIPADKLLKNNLVADVFKLPAGFVYDLLQLTDDEIQKLWRSIRRPM